MPIYEYRCGACGHTLDALQKLSEGPLRKCPGCKKSSLKRLMSAPSFRLKGGGWYETDFKSDGEKKRNLVEAPGAKESVASDGAKADGPKADSPKAESSTKETKSKESAGARANGGKPASKDAKSSPKETVKSAPKPSTARPASS